MTAYGALISLESTVVNIQKTYKISRFDEILKAPYKEVGPLQEILERLDSSGKSKSRKNVNALDGRMKHKLWDFEDLVESLLAHGIHTNNMLSEFEVRSFRRSSDEAVDYFSFFFPAIDNTMSEDDGNGDAISPSSRVASSEEIAAASMDIEEECIYDVQNEDGDEAPAISSPSTEIANMELQLSQETTQIMDVIEEIAWNLEELEQDVIENLSRTIGGLERLREAVWEIHFRRLSDAVGFLIHTLNDMKEEYIYELGNMPDDNDNDDEEFAAITSSSPRTTSACFSGTEPTKMIGLFDEFDKAKDILFDKFEVLFDEFEELSPPLISCSLVGMAGLGKTALARKLYEDPDIQRYYDCLVWIRVGRKYEFKEASREALSRVHGCKRCLIVLDDVWETGVLPIFLTTIMETKHKFIRVLTTSRGRNVIKQAQEFMPPTSHLIVKKRARNAMPQGVWRRRNLPSSA